MNPITTAFNDLSIHSPNRYTVLPPLNNNFIFTCVCPNNLNQTLQFGIRDNKIQRVVLYFGLGGGNEGGNTIYSVQSKVFNQDIVDFEIYINNEYPGPGDINKLAAKMDHLIQSFCPDVGNTVADRYNPTYFDGVNYQEEAFWTPEDDPEVDPTSNDQTSNRCIPGESCNISGGKTKSRKSKNRKSKNRKSKNRKSRKSKNRKSKNRR